MAYARLQRLGTSYNRGHPDQFFQLYDYDADNRITKVQTSSDGLIWNTDARYDYYRHGPLASLKLGQHKVQSLEYAYTIQGWLKSVNTDVLNATMDMGRNGLSMATPPPPNGDVLYARDVVAHALYYFKDDYKAIGTDVATQLSYVADKSLYNGNITQQTTGIGGVGTLQRTYTYDQLQRLKTAANKSVNDATAAVIVGPASLYASNYSYDKDGNIKTLQRWDGTPGMPVQIDNFTYNYQAGDTNNRLFQVADAAAPGSGSDLKPGQGPVNYSYDENGNLAGDLQAQHSIIWNRFGKVKTILTPSASRRIDFGYDGRGNRIWKDVVEVGPVETHRAEYYVRDAGGNQLATYRSWSRKNAADPIPLPGDTLHLSEHHIYGSSRLGIQKYDSSTIANIRPNPMAPGPLPPPQAVLNQQSAWYSYVYADRIGGAYTEPYGTTGNTDFNPTFTQRKLGRRYYELTDHLGNVLATVLDRRTGSGSFAGPGATYYDHWRADIAQASDYYPGGMMMPGRNVEYSWSRMGSQSQQKDDEIYGKGNVYAFKYRMEDARINRFFSPDPLHFKYAYNSDYAFSENRLTDGVELEGLEFSPSSRTTGKDNTAVLMMPNPATFNVQQLSAQAAHIPQATIQQDWSSTIYGSESNYEYHKALTEQTAALIPYASIGIKKARGETISKNEFLLETAFTFAPIGKIGKLLGPAGEFLLKGAGRFEGFACMDFAKDFMKQVAPTLKRDGFVVKKFEINIGRDGLIGTAEQGLSNTGKHQFVEVTKNGESMIYDNLFNKGVSKAEYMEKLGGATNGGRGTFMSGEELVKGAKEIN